jgi:DNA gyrase inhibitor GyrI
MARRRVQVRTVRLPERVVAAVPHHGPPETVDKTRRPLYQHLILNELVGGPSILRFLDPPQGDRVVDALVLVQQGFAGDEVARVEHLPAGTYAVEPFEGPVARLAEARARFAAATAPTARGPVLQVHLMDPVDGDTEQEFQRLVAPSLT